MYSVTTPAQDFQWTVQGKERVAIAIRTTLAYNKDLRIQPRSLRKLAAMAGYPNHTAIGDYANAKTDDPNRDGSRVLKDIAPFIYRIKQLDVRGHGLDRVVRVHHEVPDRKNSEYWKIPGVTYADNWEEFVLLGTTGYDSLERQTGGQDGIASDFLLNQVKAMRADAIPLAAKLLGIPASTLSALKGGKLMDKNDFTSLGQVINDFLVRITTKKAEQWDLTRLSSFLEPQVSGLTEQRLKDLVDGATPEERECARLASTFQLFDVGWETMELMVLGFAGQPQQGSLPIEDREECDNHV